MTSSFLCYIREVRPGVFVCCSELPVVNAYCRTLSLDHVLLLFDNRTRYRSPLLGWCCVKRLRWDELVLAARGEVRPELRPAPTRHSPWRITLEDPGDPEPPSNITTDAGALPSAQEPTRVCSLRSFSEVATVHDAPTIPVRVRGLLARLRLRQRI